ncbi:MAG: radical SAM protein [Gammaproteobacteria bacterium]|nr:radical SAM protein [Gammaproteobacteria bacterium]
MKNTYPIVEIFGPVVQGEGELAGLPTIFVRLGGCDYRCTQCDTMYAVDTARYKHQWQKLTAAEITNTVLALADKGMGQNRPINVTFSGGNPALFDLVELIDTLRAAPRKFTLSMETQGSVYPEWAALLDHICVSPKGPSMGYDMKAINLDVLGHYCSLWEHGVVPVYFKFVIGNRADLALYLSLEDFLSDVPIYFQPVNTQLYSEEVDLNILRQQYSDLVDLTLSSELYHVTVLPQLHVWASGSNGRGI